MSERKTEYAFQMSGGGYHIRNDDPEIEDIYPLRQWASHNIQHGQVWRRTVIVIDDWAPITPADVRAM